MFGGIGIQDEWLSQVRKAQHSVLEETCLHGVKSLLAKWHPELHDAGLLLTLYFRYQVLNGLGDDSVVRHVVTQEVGEAKEASYLSNSGQWCQLGDVLNLGWGDRDAVLGKHVSSKLDVLLKKGAFVSTEFELASTKSLKELLKVSEMHAIALGSG